MGTRLPQTFVPASDPAEPGPAPPSPAQRPSSAQAGSPKGWVKGLSAVRSKILPSSKTASPAKAKPFGGAPSGTPAGPAPLAGREAGASDVEQGEWVRLGLAAFAIAAYVRSVLAPSLVTPRTGHAGDALAVIAFLPLRPQPHPCVCHRVGLLDDVPALDPPSSRLTARRCPASAHATETIPPSPLGRVQHSHARSISMGSWRWDEHLLRELDTVLEARGELDVLEQLQGCPTLAQRGEEFHAFFALVPELLSSGMGVPAFQLRLQQLLLPGSTVLHTLQSC